MAGNIGEEGEEGSLDPHALDRDETPELVVPARSRSDGKERSLQVCASPAWEGIVRRSEAGNSSGP
jgi:hypothetical protein